MQEKLVYYRDNVVSSNLNLTFKNNLVHFWSSALQRSSRLKFQKNKKEKVRFLKNRALQNQKVHAQMKNYC